MMKKISVVVIALSISVLQFSNANAGEVSVVRGGCENCSQNCSTLDPFRKFHDETSELRQEMLDKRTELQRENLKGAPDKSKIDKLNAGIMDIQRIILSIRQKSGLPLDKSDGECGQPASSCGTNGTGSCGKSSGGCSGGQCGRR